MRTSVLTATCTIALLLTACGGGGDGGSAPTGAASAPASTPGASTPPASSSVTDGPGPGGTAAPSSLSAAAQVGQQIFFDSNLSGNKNMSCATCHSPQFAYGPPNSLAVQLGSDSSLQGSRAVPSLRYKSMTPAYADNAPNPDGVTQSAPGGGFMWDGRATTLALQTALPFLNPVEMNNASPAAVVQAVQKSSYAALFKRAFGADAFANTDTAFANVGAALQAFQIEDPSFQPYSSKFDLYLGNKVGGTLTAAETRGLKIFNNTDPSVGPAGGCSACHFAGANFNGSNALMTDFTYQALGVPRNDSQIPGNPSPIVQNDKNPSYFDMGLCGPLAVIHVPGSATSGAGTNPFTGVQEPDPYCGRFKVPTLRNVATRNAFFHNGVFHSLTQVLNFYNTRDTHPEFWYPASGGDATRLVTNPSYALFPTVATGATVARFNDLPVAFQGNIDEELPMGQGQTEAGGVTAADGAQARPVHSTPALTQQDISDLACFLNTLTDGYQPATASTSSACTN